MLRKLSGVLIIGLFIFGITGLSFAMMCGGHSQHQQTAQAEPGEHKHGEGEVTAQTTSKEAVNVGNKICPVSGEKIGEGMEAVTYEYEGKIYNFCCAMCIDEFKKDPQKYIKKVEEELQAESKEKEAEHKMQMEPESEGGQDAHRGHHH
ncbi:MAG: YHS domain-containing protein [Candidatus Omnitrophica bacterium]|nr:YHS domain-containing protein [Candidatus Omnitrophota bacterium]